MDTLCTMCTVDEPCGGHHVYVIKLDDAVLVSAKFRSQNPDYQPGKDCFYVGSTRHTVRCRFNQHVEYGRGSATFECRCFEGSQQRGFYGRHPEGRTRGNKFVGDHHRHLSGRRFKHENPFASGEDAQAREEALAHELRSRGYGVYQR